MQTVQSSPETDQFAFAIIYFSPHASHICYIDAESQRVPKEGRNARIDCHGAERARYHGGRGRRRGRPRPLPRRPRPRRRDAHRCPGRPHGRQQAQARLAVVARQMVRRAGRRRARRRRDGGRAGEGTGGRDRAHAPVRGVATAARSPRPERYRRGAGASQTASRRAVPGAPTPMRGAARAALGAKRRGDGRERRGATRGLGDVHGDPAGHTRGRPTDAVPNRRVRVALGGGQTRAVRLGR